MRVFVTGATGYIGTSLVEALRGAGHSVTGLVRSREKAEILERSGARAVTGDLHDPQAIARAAREADATIHTANTNAADAAQADIAVTRAILKALEGSGKTFIYTSGVWVLGSTGGRVADEDTPANPAALVAHRPPLEHEVLSYKDRGVRAMVIRPAAVYGRGGGGLFTMLVQSGRQTGAVRYVGEGREHWSFVHVDDLAQLYVLALEKAAAGSLYIGAHGPFHTTADVARAASIAAGAGGKIQAWPVGEARKELGAFADALALDQQISGEKAKRDLGWKPHGPDVLDDLQSGSYRQ